ncbi:MAG: PHP domain-containing protein, partial [Oscillibacter sp.]|nr:PHP domain-containing protein [Oscillibacter sp.]
MSDLHTHSTASDGQYAPAELVRLAKERGLDVMALTDHDSTDGCEEAIQTGARLGVRIIRGVELSAREYPTFHILGYAYDPSAPSLASVCGWMKAERDSRGPRIVRYLAERGMPVDL